MSGFDKVDVLARSIGTTVSQRGRLSLPLMVIHTHTIVYGHHASKQHVITAKDVYRIKLTRNLLIIDGMANEDFA